MKTKQPATTDTATKRKDIKRHTFIAVFSAILTPVVAFIFNKAGLTSTGYWIIGLILLAVIVMAFVIERQSR